VYQQKGDLHQVIADYTRLIQLSPKAHSFYNERGKAYNRLGQIDKVIEDFQKAVAIYPGNREARANLERSLEQRRAH
jgi:tetratricopeptide (TPR) repeat protein